MEAISLRILLLFGNLASLIIWLDDGEAQAMSREGCIVGKSVVLGDFWGAEV